jgi:hypothetical protein
MSTAAAPAGRAAHGARVQLYRRRRPERTRENDPDAGPVTAYVERELRGYLTCGILAHGFARARCAGCGHDFLVAFSCKGRGICPSCTTRRMAETAAHLVDHVFPKVSVRQWVVTFPKRLRYFLHRDPALLNRVLRIVLRAIETRLRRACPGAPRAARFGTVSFPQRFGSALNAHTHLHCCVTDGVFSRVEGVLRFHPAALTDADFQAVQRCIRTRVLHAAELIAADDRPALERLLRYCARPAFASERVEVLGQGDEPEHADERIRYTLPKPGPGGQTAMTLTPLELLDRLAALIPPPRRHRHHYHGAFAPHSPLRKVVTACAGQGITAIRTAAPVMAVPVARDAEPLDAPVSTPARRQAAYAWVRLLARIYEVLPLVCPRCGGEMRLIAFITQPAAIVSILTHVGEAITPPPLVPRARAPPEFDGTERALMLDPSPAWDLAAPPPELGFEFNQALGG